MKSYKIIIIALALVMGAALTANAQAPYKNGIGITAGNMQALSYKGFIGNHFAIQIDLGTKVTKGVSKNISPTIWDLELNPNFMFEGHLTGGLYGLVGIGGSIGYSWSAFTVSHWFWDSIRTDFGKCGANGIIGMEYKLKAPLAFQLDFRPGYGCLFAENFDFHYFDWSVNLGIHYTF